MLRQNLARGIGGGNDAWGQVLFYSMAQHVILPDGNAGRADYNQLLRAAVLLILPATPALEPVLVLLAVGHGGAF